MWSGFIWHRMDCGGVSGEDGNWLFRFYKLWEFPDYQNNHGFSRRTLLHVISWISTLSLIPVTCSCFLTNLVANFLANRYTVGRHECGCHCHVAISCGRCKWKRCCSDKEKWVPCISRSNSKLAARTSMQCAWHSETPYVVSVTANSSCEYHHCCFWAAWAGALCTLWQVGKCHSVFLHVKWRWLRRKKLSLSLVIQNAVRNQSVFTVLRPVSLFVEWLADL